MLLLLRPQPSASGAFLIPMGLKKVPVRASRCDPDYFGPPR